MTSANEPFGPSKGDLWSQLLWPYVVAIVLASLWVRWAELPSLFRHGPLLQTSLWCLVGLFTALSIVAFGRQLESQEWYRAMGLWLKRVVSTILGSHVKRSDAFLVALYSSVGEELLYRGALQTHIERGLSGEVGSSLPGTLGAIFIASLIFGLFHAPLVKELRPWTVFAFLVGLILGCLVAFSGSLLPAIIAHGVVNYLNLRRMNEVDFSDVEDKYSDLFPD